MICLYVEKIDLLLYTNKILFLFISVLTFCFLNNTLVLHQL